MIPGEISALVRAATATVKAHRALRRAAADEASEPVKVKYRKALHDALTAQDAALEKVATLAKRPNAPIDWAAALQGAVRALGAVKAGAAELRGAAKKIIDVEVIE